MTTLLYNQDAYKKSCRARIIEVVDSGLILDQTVFYVQGGGQPGDSGVIIDASGSHHLVVVNTVKDRETDKVIHLTEGDIPQHFTSGEEVTLKIDWERRHQHMRMHTCLHLLCSLIDAPVTGGSIRVEKSRLDFDLPEMTINKDLITEQLQTLISENHSVFIDSISDDELENNPDMIRTMSVKPPKGQGSVRLINIDPVDLQPCGGTHVRSTQEIGAIRVSKIEKKGHQNRRINIVFDVA